MTQKRYFAEQLFDALGGSPHPLDWRRRLIVAWERPDDPECRTILVRSDTQQASELPIAFVTGPNDDKDAARRYGVLAPWPLQGHLFRLLDPVQRRLGYTTSTTLQLDYPPEPAPEFKPHGPAR